ncbi:MAG: hypothetical protein IJ200_00475 [Prevotella sp.]|nr:hypothetical protein [Prevotella sp.]
MKKIYSNPKIEVVRIQTQQMLATSGDTPEVDTSQQKDPSQSDARFGWFDDADDDE